MDTGHWTLDTATLTDTDTDTDTDTEAVLGVGGGGRVHRSVRQVKMLRVVRAARYSDAMRSAIKVLSMSAYLLFSLLLMLWLTTCLYAAVGMVLFKEDYLRYDDTVDAGEFLTDDYFYNSLQVAWSRGGSIWGLEGLEGV